MYLYRIIWIAALSFFAFSGAAFAGSVMHTKIAKEHCNEMVSAGEKALDHGDLGDADVAVKHLKKMIHEAGECVKHGEEGIRASDSSEATKNHGEEAMEHVKEVVEHAKMAVKHGELGHLDILMDHVKDAMAFAYEGAKHANEMD